MTATRSSSHKIFVLRRIILGSTLAIILTACGYKETREAILDEPSGTFTELDQTTTVQACLIDLSCPQHSSLGTPSPTFEKQKAYEVNISAVQPVWLRVTVDDINVQEGRLNTGDQVNAIVRQGLEIMTGDVDSLQIMVKGQDHVLQGERGKVVTHTWNELGEYEGILRTPTPAPSSTSSPAPTSTPAVPLYELAEGNASEPITKDNAVRLMDLVHIEIGSGYDFEPAFSRDSRMMAYQAATSISEALSGESKPEEFFNIVELKTGIVMQINAPELLGTIPPVSQATFHPLRDELLLYGDSRTSIILLGEDGLIRVKKTYSHERQMRLTGQVFSPGGESVLRTSFGGSIHLFDGEGSHEQFSASVEPFVNLEFNYAYWPPALDPAFSDDGRYFAVIGEGRGLHIWRTSDTDFHYISEGAYYQDTSHLTIFGSEIAAAAPGNIYFLDIESKKITRILPSPRSITAMDYSIDGEMIAVGTDSGGLFIYDVFTNRTITSRQAHTEKITYLKFSPDGHWMATVSEDGTIALWAIP